MELITKAPKGTVDIIPGESEKWSLVEAVMTDEAELNGFSEIRTPVFEHTDSSCAPSATPPTWWKSRCTRLKIRVAAPLRCARRARRRCARHAGKRPI